MNQEQIKEQIQYLKELYRSYILLIIADGGGIAAIFIKEQKTDLEMLVLYFGTAIFIAVFAYTMYTIKDIRSLIKKIK